MNEPFLRENLEYITQRKPMPEGDTMRDVLTRLDAASKDTEIPERLEHYLTKRSYVKALEWLDNPDLPHQV